MTDEELLTVEEVAKILRVGKTMVYAIMAAGNLPSVTIGRCRRFRRSDVYAYIASLEAAHG
jgi:excisionase family DNA binding protein